MVHEHVSILVLGPCLVTARHPPAASAALFFLNVLLLFLCAHPPHTHLLGGIVFDYTRLGFN